MCHLKLRVPCVSQARGLDQGGKRKEEGIESPTKASQERTTAEIDSRASVAKRLAAYSFFNCDRSSFFRSLFVVWANGCGMELELRDPGRSLDSKCLVRLLACHTGRLWLVSFRDTHLVVSRPAIDPTSRSISRGRRSLQ
ncbi:hypothetical protein AXX17_ATUG03290 (mitochondrion) [Arabidopsis thaliana]|uniref:Uncharacterized protein n=1 Tax=Arabidopsis thaliana TaxID=3702 RepID=A0A178U5V9_ARATH|nr:hypothetical protein AXX17_ATUG03290 [Arabidopsis thaliana]